MGHPAVNLDDLSPEQQLELIGKLWDRLSERPANVPLTPEQRQELGRPWSEVREQLRSK